MKDLLFGLSVWIGLMLYGGWVLTLLWAWFVVPLGVMSISTPWGIGLMCISSMFKPFDLQKIEVNSLGEYIFIYIASSTTVLSVGFVASKFM